MGSVDDLSLFAGAYWGPRQESGDQCGDRMWQCLQGLAALDPRLDEWRRKGKPREDAQVLVRSVEDTQQLLLAGVNVRDDAGGAMLGLGFNGGLWNGNSDAVASVGVTCGSWNTASSVPNSIVIDLPPLPSGLDKDGYVDYGRGVIGVLIEAWDPDLAVLSSYDMIEFASRAFDAIPGWLTFVRGTVPGLYRSGFLHKSRTSRRWRRIYSERKPVRRDVRDGRDLAEVLDEKQAIQARK